MIASLYGRRRRGAPDDRTLGCLLRPLRAWRQCGVLGGLRVQLIHGLAAPRTNRPRCQRRPHHTPVSSGAGRATLTGKLIPTRVKADSFRGFQSEASQIPWWRTGGSPCGQGLRFARINAAQLRSLAKATRNAGQSRRLLALAEIYDGGSRTKAAQVGGVGLQTIRDWVVRFTPRGPEGLIDGKAPGNTCKLNDSQRQAVTEMVEN